MLLCNRSMAQHSMTAKSKSSFRIYAATLTHGTYPHQVAVKILIKQDLK